MKDLLSELSKKTLASYIKKASARAIDHANQLGHVSLKDKPAVAYFKRHLRNKKKGITRAANKLAKKHDVKIKVVHAKAAKERHGRSRKYDNKHGFTHMGVADLAAHGALHLAGAGIKAVARHAGLHKLIPKTTHSKKKEKATKHTKSKVPSHMHVISKNRAAVVKANHNFKIKYGKLHVMSAAEKFHRKSGAHRAAVKNRTHMARTIMRRHRTMKRKQSIGA